MSFDKVENPSKTLLVDCKVKKKNAESPNLKLAYIAAVLNKANVETKLIDFIIPQEPLISLEVFDKYREKFIENISKYSSQYQYIYFDCEYGMLTFIEKCVENINSLTKSFPDRRTIENSDLCANSPKKL